jgi:hypothetical protein
LEASSGHNQVFPASQQCELLLLQKVQPMPKRVATHVVASSTPLMHSNLTSKVIGTNSTKN